MRKFWQDNNPNIKVIEKQLEQLKNSDTEDKEKKINSLKVKLLQEDMISQIGWIAVRSCAGIRCKECYLKPACRKRNVEESSPLAIGIMKNQKDKENGIQTR